MNKEKTNPYIQLLKLEAAIRVKRGKLVNYAMELVESQYEYEKQKGEIMAAQKKKVAKKKVTKTNKKK